MKTPHLPPPWARMRHFMELIVLGSQVAMPLHAEVNSWTKSTSGEWQEETSWTLGVLPDSSQSVAITNQNEKTITINAATARSFPQSLTVNSLIIGATNRLMLNNAGTEIPLVMTNGLRVIGANPTNPATLINLQSGLVVENGSLEILNGQIIQDGGFIKITNGTAFLSGSFYLTNGLFEANTVRFGFSSTGFSYQSGFFHQFGGNANLGTLHLGSVSHGSTYSIYGGELNVSGDLDVGGQIEDSHFKQHGGRVTADGLRVGSHFGGNSYILNDGELIVKGRMNIGSSFGLDIFLQEGGTNRTSELKLMPVASFAKYKLNGGLLCTSNVVLAVGFAEPVFEQNGGIHIVTNTLSLLGSADRYGTDYAKYFLVNGYLSAGSIEVQAGIFQQTNSTTLISGTLQLGLNEKTRFGKVNLDGGTVACSNVTYASAGSDIFQNGGEFIVTNLFSFGGHRNWYPPVQPQYFFSGGMLTTRDIELAADMIIGSTTEAGRITNPGYFKMAGRLTSGDANEQLGRFILASNSIINLGDGCARLSFADSSFENWTGGETLLVTNWNGTTNGDGDDQLKFGINASGLTVSQLNQVRFVNPAGFPSGEFAAEILNTGEVVPKVGPTLSFALGEDNLVLTWISGFTLQTATNVAGTYQDLLEATSPHTNAATEPHERYFRLRRSP